MTPCHDNISLVVVWFRHIGSTGEKVDMKIISRYSFILVNYKDIENTNCNDGINEYEKCVPCINICVVLSEKLLLLAAF
jgi:hypothetical protein